MPRKWLIYKLVPPRLDTGQSDLYVQIQRQEHQETRGKAVSKFWCAHSQEPAGGVNACKGAVPNVPTELNVFTRDM